MQFKSSTIIDNRKKNEILNNNLKLLEEKLSKYESDTNESDLMVKYINALSENNILVKDVSENGTFESEAETVNCSIYSYTRDGIKELANQKPVVIDTKGQVIDNGILAHRLYFYNYNRKQCIDYHIIGKNISNGDFDIDVTKLPSKKVDLIVKTIMNEISKGKNNEIEEKVLKKINNKKLFFKKTLSNR